MLVSSNVCVAVGETQRVLWPAPPKARFECADYFLPQERLSVHQMTQLVEFLAACPEAKSLSNRGRYGFAMYLRQSGPDFVRAMPAGYVVELVQLLINKNLVTFTKGTILFKYDCCPDRLSVCLIR